MLNDGSWQVGDGPLHDEAAEQMFLKLQQLHNDYCLHVDINIPDDVQTGSTYVFDQSDPSNANHPLGFKHAGSVYTQGVEASGVVGNAGAVLTFTVPVDAPDSLDYYCKFHPGMSGGVVHIEDAMDMRRSLQRVLQDHGDHAEVTYEMACNTDYSSNPRLAFQMSIFCALGFIDQSIDTTKSHVPYELSSSCDTMMRHNSRHQMYPEVMYAPDMFCDQDVEADTCTVRAYVRTTEQRTCAEYCEGFDLECKAAGDEYYTNENDRSYTKLTLTLDVDGETGKVSVADIEATVDKDVSDIDTYNTAHVEFCDGFESLRREGDAEEKCSFGHRLDKSQNCYGKVYGQNFNEASKSCAERGGHIVKIDDAAEYDVLKSIFGDQSFFIGLHDVGGRDWEWDGYPGVSTDPYANTYAPLAATEQWDCAQIDLEKNELTTDECWERRTWMCEGIPSADDVANGRGGDLLADE
eukprot:g20465.t1